MRPIDADALLERVDEERKYLLARGQTGAEHILVHNFRNLIDDAPTIFNCNTCKNMGNERECVDCYDYSNYIRYDKRPQGEWSITDETDEFYGRVYKCTHCGKEMLACSCRNFCTWCGASMEVKKND